MNEISATESRTFAQSLAIAIAPAYIVNIKQETSSHTSENIAILAWRIAEKLRELEKGNTNA